MELFGGRRLTACGVPWRGSHDRDALFLLESEFAVNFLAHVPCFCSSSFIDIVSSPELAFLAFESYVEFSYQAIKNSIQLQL
jgi:hypothetical protein